MNVGVQPDEVYAKLRAGAQDMFVGNTQGSEQPTAGPDRFTGYGFLNAGKALVSPLLQSLGLAGQLCCVATVD